MRNFFMLLLACVLGSVSPVSWALATCSSPMILSGDGQSCIEPQWSAVTDISGISPAYMVLAVGCALMFGFGASFGRAR